MDVKFADEKLERLATETGFSGGYPPEIVRAYRMRLQSFRAAADESVLTALKSLQIQRNGHARRRSVRLRDDARLIIDLRTRRQETILQVVGIQNSALKGRRTE